MRRTRLLSLLAALTLVVAACGGDDTATETTQAAATDTSAPATTSAAPETTMTEAPATTTTAPATTTTAASSGSSEALAEFQAALSDTAAAESGRMEGSFAITGLEGAPAGTEFTMPFSGAFDNAAGTFSFVLDMSGMASIAGEELPPGFEDLFGELEVRQVGDVAYMRFPFFSAFLGVETEWLRMPASEAGDAAGGFGGVAPSNPGEFLSAFEGADATVEEIGTESVRGVETTHYRITVDTEALLAEATPEQRAELEAQGPLPSGEFPMDMWIGGDGYVYRYILVFDGTLVEAEPGEGFESMTMTFEMYDYNAPIDIAEPDPSEVTDAEDLGGLFEF